MQCNYDTILKKFEKKVNLLIADDKKTVLSSVKNLFHSELFNITAVSTIDDALEEIKSAKAPWHCWVLDIAFGEERSGIDILKEYPQFPFVLMLSGLQSMTLASEAADQGALKVFDKDPKSLHLLYDEVCKVAALGYILNGKSSQYLSTFLILTKTHFLTKGDWAEAAELSLRHLERICELHSPLPPRLILALYYSIYYLLFKGSDIKYMQDDTSTTSQETSDRLFYESQLNFLEKHLDKIP